MDGHEPCEGIWKRRVLTVTAATTIAALCCCHNGGFGKTNLTNVRIEKLGVAIQHNGPKC